MTKFVTMTNGIPHLVNATGSSIYDATYVASGTITNGTAITLPSSQTYSSSELQVYLNGVAQEYSTDYVYVGSGTRTQISMNIDLVQGDRLRFRIQ
jgi:hypothetical protein